jgi:hypothetical protein
MCSGGLGSIAALWNIISWGRDASILFVEDLFGGELEKVRVNCIKKTMLEARADGGKPLASDPPFQTW